MENLNIIEKLQEILSLIQASPFFLSIFAIFIFILSFVFIDIKTTSKIRTKFLIFIWVVTVAFIGYSYYEYFIKLSDNLAVEIFTAIYFPNLAIYTIIIIVSNYIFISRLLKKNVSDCYKVADLVNTLIIDFLFIVTLETIIKNKIDIYEPLTVYSNKTLLVLLELSSGTFTIWLLILWLFKLVFNKVGIPKLEAEKTEKIEEATIYESSYVYDAPVNNIYENNTYKEPYIPNEEIYNDVFNIEYIEPVKVAYIDNFDNHLYHKIEDIILVEPSLEPVYFTRIAIDEEMSKIKEDYLVNVTKRAYIDNFDNHLYHKIEDIILVEPSLEPVYLTRIAIDEEISKIKEEETIETPIKQVEESRFRVPLFDTIDDPIMNILNSSKEENYNIKTTIVKHMTVSFEEELYNKFSNGDTLDVEQYKVLKNYLMNR